MVYAGTKVSPESAPSISATTASSASYIDQVVRELFHPSPVTLLNQDIELKDIHPINRETLDVSSLSVDSDTSVTNHADIDCFDSTLRDNRYDTVFPGCHGTVNLSGSSKNLATMFNIFDASQNDNNNDAYSTDANSTSKNSSMNDAATEIVSNIDHSIVIWERKIDSLEREIATLKSIIKADSVTILRLKTEIAAFHETETPQQSHGGKSDEETIQLQNEEIEVLSTRLAKKVIPNDNRNQLRLENELFASQIIENESEIREARDMIAQIAEENMKLNVEVSELRAQQSSLLQQESVDEVIDLTTKYNSLKAEMVCMANWMAEMEQKLEKGYYCKCSQGRYAVSQKSIEGTMGTIDAMGSNLLDDESLDSCHNNGSNEEAEERNTGKDVLDSDVEVTIEGEIITSTGTEGRSEPLKCLTANSAQDGDPSNLSRIKSNADVVGTGSNFCGCLRVTNNDKDK